MMNFLRQYFMGPG